VLLTFIVHTLNLTGEWHCGGYLLLLVAFSVFSAKLHWLQQSTVRKNFNFCFPAYLVQRSCTRHIRMSSNLLGFQFAYLRSL